MVDSSRSLPLHRPLPGTLFATLVIGAATLAAWWIDHAGLSIGNISVVYLLGVMVVATKAGPSLAFLTALTSFLLINFLFTEPRYTLSIHDPGNVLTVILFLVAAALVAQMTANLYDFARHASAAATIDDALAATCRHLAQSLNARSVVLLAQEDGLVLRASDPPLDHLDPASAQAAHLSWVEKRTFGRGVSAQSPSLWLFTPLPSGQGRSDGMGGVLGVLLEEDADLPPQEKLHLLDAMASQAAVVLERISLAQDIERVRMATERERLRSALLSSLSHDLRTPLSSILGAATALGSFGPSLDDDSRKDLAQTIEDEAQRLNRFVQNLLDMTRLGTGDLVLRADWVDLGDILADAVRRAQKLRHAHPIRLQAAADLPLIRADAVLLGQALFNLLDNACKFAPGNSPVTVWAAPQAAGMALEVVDQGPGIPASDREKVFDMFHRVDQTDSRSGTGLGLAICRGIIQAHGGTIQALDGQAGQGTAMRIHLPLPPQPSLDHKGPSP